MMKLDDTILEKAELLSKLKIEQSEREKTISEMEKLLAYVEKLNEVDTEDVLPLSHGEPGGNCFREDTVTNSDGMADTLLNAPEEKNGQFVVPKTV